MSVHLEEEAQPLPHQLAHPLRRGHRHRRGLRAALRAARGCTCAALRGRERSTRRGVDALLLPLAREEGGGARRVAIEVWLGLGVGLGLGLGLGLEHQAGAHRRSRS